MNRNTEKNIGVGFNNVEVGYMGDYYTFRIKDLFSNMVYLIDNLCQAVTKLLKENYGSQEFLSSLTMKDLNLITNAVREIENHSLSEFKITLESGKKITIKIY